MILGEYEGDMFGTDMQTLTIPVNTVGVMGKGLALLCAKRFPHVPAIYREHCYQKLFRQKLLTVPVDEKRQVLLLPTKQHWRNDSNLWLINNSLEILVRDYEELNIKSLALPQIGCGNGNLDYEDVRPCIFKHLDPIPVCVKIYI